MRPPQSIGVIAVTEEELELMSEERLLELVAAAGLSTDGIESLPALRRMISLSGRKTTTRVV